MDVRVTSLDEDGVVLALTRKELAVMSIANGIISA